MADIKEAADALSVTAEGLPTIVWYPGHMAKAKRLISDNLKLVDVVIELVDARIPVASANPMLKELIGRKPRLIVLNKMDLASPAITKAWVNYYKSQGIAAVAVDAAQGKGIKELVKLTAKLAAGKTKRFENKGAKARAPRAMVLGIPNVGKSSLINRLAGKVKAKAENRPGVTRAKQWIHIEDGFDLLDMPGILWPKFDDPMVGLHLSYTGAISDEAIDTEPVVLRLLAWLRENFSRDLVNRYKLELAEGESLPEDNVALLELIGRKRGHLEKGGVVNHDKTKKLLLKEFRAGLIGKYTLDLPPQKSAEKETEAEENGTGITEDSRD